MKTKLLLAVLAALMLLPAEILAQRSPSGSALKSMVETEQAFAKTSEEKGTRDAFMAFIADDGILFRPTAVIGKQWMNEHPLPPSDKRSLLTWQPAFAGMAASGDLGYTTGPWEFKDDIKNEHPSGYGHFVTVWKKQADGSWKFVLDLGISHPESGGPLKVWQVEGNIPNKPMPTVEVETARRTLLERDNEFSAASLKQGFSKAFLSYSDPDVRLYREGSVPFVGKQSAKKALMDIKWAIKWEPKGGDVSEAGDLGYTTGVYEASDPKTLRVSERGNYLRIWKKQGRVWSVVLDVANPLPQ
jgi:ketosteroid isomerase-like protein